MTKYSKIKHLLLFNPIFILVFIISINYLFLNHAFCTEYSEETIKALQAISGVSVLGNGVEADTPKYYLGTDTFARYDPFTKEWKVYPFSKDTIINKTSNHCPVQSGSLWDSFSSYITKIIDWFTTKT